MSSAQPRVLLCAMPYLHPSSTSLALGLLGAILRKQGLEVECLYGALRYPRTPLWDTEAGIRFLTNYGGLLFGAYLAPDRAAYQAPFVQYMAQDFENERTLQGLGGQVVNSAPRAESFAFVAGEIEHAGTCLERCEADALAREHDVVGFSITFFTQLPASLALARRLKARRPELPIVFGGAGCAGEQAEGFLRAFPEIDAVCYTEADDIAAPLMRALASGADLGQVPGIVYRGPGGVVVRTEPPELRTALDDLPLPEHDDYFAQQAASEWADLKAIIYFETARGCWWGQKHLCTFCGLSERELRFRSKSPERVYDEVVALYRRHPTLDYLHPTDDIMDPRYVRTLLPRLARLPREEGRPLNLFFEVKSNLKPAQLMLLAAAGVSSLQPGIESFSDEVLRHMDKGQTGLGQVQFVKWASEAGIHTVYNILVRNPGGDTAAAYREMAELVPQLEHLPPPQSVVLTELERFSVYYKDPARFGLTDIRPKAYHHIVFPDVAPELLAQIAYRFDYDHPCKHDVELIAAQSALVAAVNRWRATFKPHRLLFVDRGDHLVVSDQRAGHGRVEVLHGHAAALFRYLDAHRSFAQVQRKFDLDATLLRALLEVWRARGWLTSTAGDLHLVLVPRAYEQRPSIEELEAWNTPAPRPPPERGRLAVLEVTP